MKCHEVELLLYDRLTGRAAPDVCHTVDAHLEHCARCQAASDAMQRTLAQLETWTVPAPAPDFQARLQARVTAHLHTTTTRAEPPTEPVAAPPTPRPTRDGLASLLRRQWFPLVGLAMAATLASIVVVYQGVGPGDHPPAQMTKGLQLEFASPILIETPDPARTLTDLVPRIRAAGGDLLRQQPVGADLELTITIASQREQELLQQLESLGHVTVPPSGYTDREGHLLIRLTKAGTFSR